MFPVNDLLDAILIGTFLFGILFTIGSLLLGVADLHADSGTHGDGLFHGVLNVSSLLAFLTWFGGIAYLFRNGAGWATALSLVTGVLGGLIGAAIIGWFLRTILQSETGILNPKDFDRVGVLARVTSGIRSGGVGEIVFEQAGSRIVASAMSESSMAVPKGTEVVILRVERGMAIVAPFDELLASSRETPGAGMHGAHGERPGV